MGKAEVKRRKKAAVQRSFRERQMRAIVQFSLVVLVILFLIGTIGTVGAMRHANDTMTPEHVEHPITYQDEKTGETRTGVILMPVE